MQPPPRVPDGLRPPLRFPFASTAGAEEDRERIRQHRRLTEEARAWLEHDRDLGALYRGARLARAEELFPADSARRAALLTASEREFLRAAICARDAERQAASRSIRRSRVLLTAFSAVVAVALEVGLAAWQQRRDNERQRTDTAARRVAEVADAMRTTDPRTAMLLGVAAWRVAPLPEARRALLGSLAQAEHAIFTDPAAGDGPRRFLADSGRTLLSVEGRTWRTWAVCRARRTGSGRLPAGQVFAAGPDARVLASGDGMRLWDTVTGRWTGDPRPLPFTVADLANGGFLVSEGDDVRLHSVTDGRVLFENRSAGLVTPALSKDGRLVALCPEGKAPQVRDTARHRTLPGPWERARDLCAEDQETSLVFGGPRLADSATLYASSAHVPSRCPADRLRRPARLTCRH